MIELTPSPGPGPSERDIVVNSGVTILAVGYQRKKTVVPISEYLQKGFLKISGRLFLSLFFLVVGIWLSWN